MHTVFLFSCSCWLLHKQTYLLLKMLHFYLKFTEPTLGNEKRESQTGQGRNPDQSIRKYIIQSWSERRAQTNREIKKKAYSIREIQAHHLDQVDNQNGKTVQAGQLCTENQVRWSKPGELSKTGNRSTPEQKRKM